MKTLTRTATAALALVTAAAACTSPAGEAGPSSPARRPLGAVRLVAYSSCDDMLAGLREHAARTVGPWGFGGPMLMMERRDTAMAVPQAKSTVTLEHSTTNTHEAGVDEPDLVKTDGARVVTVTGGTLRIIDAATREVTAKLRLTGDDEPAFLPADLLMSGDRALVLLRGGGIMYKSIAPMKSDTRYVLVDLSGKPKVLSTIRPRGQYVDARMVGSVVRIVTRSEPDITLPQAKDDATDAERRKLNQRAVRTAPAGAWQPKVEITDASGAKRELSVPCERISHPADYTGASLLTVHTLDLARGVTDAGTDPITLAADGDIVYGTGQSLYVASNPRWWPVDPAVMEDTAEPVPDAPSGTAQAPIDDPTPAEPTVTATNAPKATRTPVIPPEETEVHRFDIGSPGPPVYAASGKVPGRLLNQYSLSEHEGHLRVATTVTSDDGERSESGVHVLRTSDMAETGQVGGLGKGERIYSVRFIGPVGYVVTFRQVDPLYTLDLRDPAAPKVTGELKITGYSAYLHPGGDGRLIGIGQEASEKGRTMGTQVSLFDVNDPAAPRRLSQLFQKDSGSEAEWDPHAFLFWPKTGTAVIPLNSYGPNTERNGAVVLKITDSAISRVGMIEHPRKRQSDMVYQPGIQRSMVIGDAIWTVSDTGVQVNDAASLARRSWIPFS
ncbi:beta-propeller domain-containing protein [Nonomuraea roseoviolacea]|uniref:Secreted protein with C-terminal beta-propeller domain n=1 Tax=Nonomuraea roseoviolacea subsp. carminata TaxID=160689 RepID=A0ABT1JXU7_9ACTN|nr:beta-propeller domain-containing protein [Nonomuraea roseoviolacea]MCP2346147.1 putative secreted protein with C-terminal beta-propeller domain [Nonomuraea roseoviolacea subsp. carminata]